jgi:hypothetical protein
MYSDDDIHYALDMTRVIREPDRRIDTFGSTRFQFHLVTEQMDRVNEVRVREGRIEAEKPQILTPTLQHDLDLDGFGEPAQAFADYIRRNHGNLKFLQYGFTFRKSDVTESIVHDPFDEVCERVSRDIEASGNPLAAVIQGVDDTWEICLLKFTIEMIERSRDTNLFDFRRRGLL